MQKTKKKSFMTLFGLFMRFFFFLNLSYKPCDLYPLQVLPHDELMETKKSHRHSHRKKVLPEIYLTRLLSTKVTS